MAKRRITVLAEYAPVAVRSRAPLRKKSLVRRTQELFDSVAGEGQGPWKYFAEDAMYRQTP